MHDCASEILRICSKNSIIDDMTIVTPRRPSGFPEYTPAQQLAFNGLLAKIRTSYELAGFTPIETPALELADVLLAKGGGETEKEVFRFGKGSKDYVMHYDLTVPLARYVAERQNDLVFPFRRSQIQKVWRAERAQKGRAREFYQCDADVVGETDVAVDGELIALAATTMRNLAISKFTVRVNNRKVLTGMYEALGVADKSVELMRIIDKLEKIGEAEVRKLLSAEGLEKETVDTLVKTSNLHGAPDSVLADLRSLQLTNDTFVAGVEELERAVAAALATGAQEDEIIVDCAIARGLDYYTATVFETVLTDIPELGSVCSGGRFDNLAQYYTRRSLPGVGISIGLTRLFDGLWDAGHFDGARATTTQIIVWAGCDEAWSEAGKLTAELRAEGMASELSLSDTKLTKVLSRASKLGMKAVAIIGEDELAQSVVSVKILESGLQEQIPLAEVKDFLHKNAL
ncbi:MAG: histidyl-tRNA synthetase [Patescibacteria group bacterium]|jgi:histidyl-tRNA synthetase|nr:histidyl-tRNA synthetase [Patescibacteria group bacterium]